MSVWPKKRLNLISHIDHIVLTVSPIQRSVDLYKRVLLIKEISFSNGRKAMKFGNEKINFQHLGEEPRSLSELVRVTCA